MKKLYTLIFLFVFCGSAWGTVLNESTPSPWGNGSDGTKTVSGDEEITDTDGDGIIELNYVDFTIPVGSSITPATDALVCIYVKETFTLAGNITLTGKAPTYITQTQDTVPPLDNEGLQPYFEYVTLTGGNGGVGGSGGGAECYSVNDQLAKGGNGGAGGSGTCYGGGVNGSGGGGGVVDCQPNNTFSDGSSGNDASGTSSPGGGLIIVAKNFVITGDPGSEIIYVNGIGAGSNGGNGSAICVPNPSNASGGSGASGGAGGGYVVAIYQSKTGALKDKCVLTGSSGGNAGTNNRASCSTGLGGSAGQSGKTGNVTALDISDKNNPTVTEY